MIRNVFLETEKELGERERKKAGSAEAEAGI